MIQSFLFFLANPSRLVLILVLLYIFAILFSCIVTVLVLKFKPRNTVLLGEIKIFFSSLTLIRKIAFLHFFIFSASPNLVFVHNGFSFVGNFLITSSILLGSIAYPWVILLFMIRLLFVLKSGAFGVLYDFFPSFQKRTISYVFNGDKIFSEHFIFYFYGNVWQAAYKVAKAGVPALTGFAFYSSRKEIEELKVEAEVEAKMREMHAFHKDGGHVVTPTQALEYRAIFIREAEAKAPLTRFHRSVEDLSEKLSDSVVEKAFPGILGKDAEKEAFIKSQEFANFYAIHRSSKLKSKSLNKAEENSSDPSE